MEDALYYQGHWTQDRRDGKGYLFLRSGHIFSGTFKNDRADGPGQLFVDGLRALDQAGGHEDLYARVSQTTFVVGNAAQRYGLAIPSNAHLQARDASSRILD